MMKPYNPLEYWGKLAIKLSVENEILRYELLKQKHNEEKLEVEE